MLKKTLLFLCFVTIAFANNLNHYQTVSFQMNKKQLTDNGATNWYATINLGEQPLKFMLDTGTTNSWVTSSYCETISCNTHSKFDPKKSSTYHAIGDPKNPETFNLGAWGQFKAFLAEDRLDYGITQINYFKFLLATYYQSDNYTNLVMDGGFAFPSYAKNEQESDLMLDLLVRNGYIAQRKISFITTSQDTTLVKMGFFDTSDFIELPLKQERSKASNLWVVGLDSFSVGEQVIYEDIDFVADTGSSRFKGDPKLIESITNIITKNGDLPSTLPIDNPNFDRFEPISLRFPGNYTFTLQPSQYFLKIKDVNGEMVYKLGFHPLADESLNNTLLVGSLFLDYFPSSYDFDNKKLYLLNNQVKRVIIR